jgi:hypothetical protein
MWGVMSVLIQPRMPQLKAPRCSLVPSEPSSFVKFRFTICGLLVSGRDIIKETFCGMIKSLTAIALGFHLNQIARLNYCIGGGLEGDCTARYDR